MTELTYTNIPTSGPAQLRFWARNCRKLARIMARLRPEQHRQDDYVQPAANFCQTSGCAIGWAALSNEFNGLQWMKNGFPMPVVNGMKSNWVDASEQFFGRDVYEDIFSDLWMKRDSIIAQLRDFARRYEQQATGESQ